MVKGSVGTKQASYHPDVLKKKVTSRELEKLEVARLSCNIESCSKPSGIFERLQEKRRIRHENVLKQLAEGLHEVNLKIEMSIKLSAVELKAQIKGYDDKMRITLEGLDRLEVGSYNCSNFSALQKKTNEYKAEQQKLVNEFYEDLINLENKRAKENARLLHIACEEIRKIGYFLPYYVQAFAECEALKLNQLTLNNRRCYEDLKLTLTLVTEQAFKSFMDTVFCIREQWIQRKQLDAFYINLTDSEEKSSGVSSKHYARLELRGEELPIRLKPSNMHNVCTAEEWIANVDRVVTTIGTFGKNLIDVFKKTIKAIYNGFNAEVEEIKGGFSLIANCIIEERMIYPLIIEVENVQTKEIEDLETQWQNTLEDIRNQLKYVTEFVRDIGMLWDSHAERVFESKKLILKALEKTDQNNQSVLLDLEIKLNLALDALRQEHILSKLDKTYESVVAILEELKAKHESMFLEEVSIVEDFYKMMKLEADVLTAELQEFIYETNEVKIVQVYSGQFRYIREIDFGGKPTARDMKLCAQQIHNLKFWKQGIWIALETVSTRTRECLQPRAESWVKSRIAAFAEKKSTQMELLDRRFQRIKVEIYEKRIAEVKAHQEMYDKHKEKIWLNLKKAEEDLQNLVTNQLNRIMGHIKTKLGYTERKSLLENLPGVIRGNQGMIQRNKAELEYDIQNEFGRFRANCETRMSDNQQVNIKYMKSVKLFHENGNYNSEEAKTIINLLEVIDRDIVSELKSAIRESTKEENEILKKLSAIFNPIITQLGSLYEETTFNQEIQQRLQKFKTHIQESAKILKQDFDFFVNHFQCIGKCMENVANSNAETELLWNFLTQMLYQNVSNVIYPLQLTKSPAQNDEEEKSEEKSEEKKEENVEENVEEDATGPPICDCLAKYPFNFPSSNKFLYHKSDKPDGLTCKDYRNQLYNCVTPLDNDGTFMATMCKNFTTELGFIQRIACNFYKKIHGRKILRNDLLPASYEEFIEGILLKFFYYNAQIQEYWLQIVKEFLPLVGTIKFLANAFIEKKIEDYKNLALTVLKNYEAAFRDCIESECCENAKEFEELDSKLLPLHGYPHNSHLLNDLEDLVVRRTADQEVKWEMAFKSFKNQLKCFRVHHIQEKREINKIQLQYNKLKDTIFVDGLGGNLIEEIQNICENGGFCLKKSSKESIFDKRARSSSIKFEGEDIPEEHKLNLELENMQSVQENIALLKRLIKYARPLGSTPSQKSVESYLGENMRFWQANLNVILEIVDLKDPVSKTVEALEQYIRYLKTFAESQEKIHEIELFKWLNKWKLNVKKIQKLYRVVCQENPSALGGATNGEYVILCN